MEKVKSAQYAGRSRKRITCRTTQTPLVKWGAVSRNWAIFGCAFSIILSLGGCSTVIHKEFSLGDEANKALSVDAQQRLVFVTHRENSEKNRQVICAEPSPDVFAALAASTSGGADFGGKKLEFASSIAQSAAELGPRTQTIQLLRDGLYRACEAYMNGALNGQAYRQILHGYDEILITLVAIDGLTAKQPEQPTKSTGKPGTKPSNPSGTGAAASKTETPAADASVANKPSASATATTSSPSAGAVNAVAVDADVAAQVHGIVHDYYCFQLVLKKAFYADAFKDVPVELIDKMCAPSSKYRVGGD